MLHSEEIIGSARKYYKMSLKTLSYGICTESHMARIEKGERSVEKLMFEALYQRIGKYSGRYELLVNLDEYQRYMERRRVKQYLDEKKYKEAELIIENYKNTVKKKLDLQVMQLLECELKYRTGSSVLDCRNMLMDGIRYTIPSFSLERFEEFYYSRIEMVMVQQYVRFTELMGDMEYAVDMYERILSYLEQERYDRSERAILYSYVGYLLTQNYIEQRQYDKAIKLAQKTYEETLKAQTVSFVVELKECITTCREKLGYDTEIEKRYIRVLKDMLKKYGAKDILDYFPRHIEENLFCVNDIVKQRRRMFGIIQEDFLDICSTSTISLIENKHRTIRDDKRETLLHEMKLLSGTYIGSVDAVDWEIYELLNMVNDCVMSYDADGAEEILDTVEKKYDLTTINSKQHLYILREQLNIMRTGKTSELIEEIEELLKESLGDFKNQSLDGVILLENEMHLLERIITRHKNEEQYDKAMFYLYPLAKTYSEADMKDTYKYVNVCRYIGDVLGEAGKVDEANEYVIEGIKGAVQADFMPYLKNLSYCYVWNIFNKKKSINKDELLRFKEMLEC